MTGWRAWVLGERATTSALIIAFVVALPFCATGLFVDDYFHQLAIEGFPLVPVSRWELFSFAFGDPARLTPLIERGPYSWWTLPELKFSFYRPLSCALANLDHLAFGRAFFFHHLHSVGWYLALVAVVAALLRRALGAASSIAALGVVLFALDDAHSIVVGWLANRNALVATVPVLLGVLAHLRWREHGDRRGLVASIGFIIIGLSAGEPALGAIAYLVAYELAAGPGTWGQRARALLPVAFIGVAYVFVYRAVGAGTRGSEVYIDPLRDPGGFLTNAPARALALLGAQFVGVTSDLWLTVLASRPIVIGSGVIAVIMLVVLLRRLWPTLDAHEQRGVKWLFLGSLLSIVPVLATFPANRLLLMPSVGGSAVLALLFVKGWNDERRVTRYAVKAVWFSTVIIGLLGWPATAMVMKLGAEQQTRAALETPMSDEALSRRVVVFVAPDPTASLYTPMVRMWNHKPPSESWNTLSFAPFAHRLKRTSLDTVELEVVDGRMLETIFEQLMRSVAKFPIQPGMRVQLYGLDVTVLELDAGQPKRIAVHFDQNPDLGGYTLAQWVDGTLTPLVLPAVGETRELPRLRGLLSQ